jgi:hypothetical protein
MKYVNGEVDEDDIPPPIYTTSTLELDELLDLSLHSS